MPDNEERLLKVSSSSLEQADEPNIVKEGRKGTRRLQHYDYKRD